MTVIDLPCPRCKNPVRVSGDSRFLEMFSAWEILRSTDPPKEGKDCVFEGALTDCCGLPFRLIGKPIEGAGRWSDGVQVMRPGQSA